MQDIQHTIKHRIIDLGTEGLKWPMNIDGNTRNIVYDGCVFINSTPNTRRVSVKEIYYIFKRCVFVNISLHFTDRSSGYIHYDFDGYVHYDSCVFIGGDIRALNFTAYTSRFDGTIITGQRVKIKNSYGREAIINPLDNDRVSAFTDSANLENCTLDRVTSSSPTSISGSSRITCLAASGARNKINLVDDSVAKSFVGHKGQLQALGHSKVYFRNYR